MRLLHVTDRVASPRLVLAVGVLAAVLSLPSWASAQRVEEGVARDSAVRPGSSSAASAALAQHTDAIDLCIVPGSGTAYRVGGPGTPTDCLAASHSRLTLNLVGPVGPAGPVGAKGDSGATGAVGPAGAKGDSGPQGVMGEMGPAGAQGEPGATGDPGEPGAQGEPGERGEAGPAGPAGADGAAGAPGPAGVPGAAGAPGTTDHAALSNLTSDDHTQYLLANGARAAGLAGFAVTGTVSIGATAPVSGAGTRLMWIPGLSAFRAGTVAGDMWDAVNVGRYSTALGFNTIASGDHAIALGQGAVASDEGAFAIGAEAAASAPRTIAIGTGARAMNGGSIAIGALSVASGFGSIVIGRGADSDGQIGAIVISDGGAEFGADPLKADGALQFVARGIGGVTFFTDVHNSVGARLEGGGGSWDVVSDRTKKADFRAVDGESLLATLRRVPVSSWRYKAQGSSIRHIGPMAQDWDAAFALSGDSTTINSGDLAGVTLAGVQALDVRSTATQNTVLELEARVRALELQVQALLDVRSNPR